MIFPEEPFTSYMSYARNGRGRPQADWTDLTQSSPALTVAQRSWRIRALVLFKTTAVSQEKHNILAILSIESEKAKYLNFEKTTEDFAE
jgi:hypothetical protein